MNRNKWLFFFSAVFYANINKKHKHWTCGFNLSIYTFIKPKPRK